MKYNDEKGECMESFHKWSQDKESFLYRYNMYKKVM